DAQVVMISGHGTIQTAVEATQLGAYDFLEKPLDTDRILLTLRNALQHIDLASENVRLKAEVHAQYEIVGSSRAVKQVIERIEKVAPTAARVLITGETATNKDLQAEIAAGRFREDLLYRLNVVPIEVPPLRARRADVAQLVAHFVTQMTRSGGLPPKPFDPEAVQQLAARDWPGNIRELRNAIDRLLKKLPAADPTLGRPSGGEPTVRKPAAAPGSKWSSGATPPSARERVGTWAKVALGVLVGIGIAPGVWPYSHGCGVRLIFYLL